MTEINTTREGEGESATNGKITSEDGHAHVCMGSARFSPCNRHGAFRPVMSKQWARHCYDHAGHKAVRAHSATEEVSTSLTSQSLPSASLIPLLVLLSFFSLLLPFLQLLLVLVRTWVHSKARVLLSVLLSMTLLSVLRSMLSVFLSMTVQLLSVLLPMTLARSEARVREARVRAPV